MTSRQKVMDIFNHKSDGSGAMWTGHPNHATVPIYSKAWNIEESEEAIFKFLHDDCRWYMGDFGYKNPLGLPMFNYWHGINKSVNLSSEGCFAGIEDLKEIDNHPWPEVKDLDFSLIYDEMKKHQDKMIFSGMWSAFFHNMCDYLGMENYFIQMYENPIFVEALTNRIVDFYIEANEKFFTGVGELCDVMFMGNDFGTQLDLFISPENFRKFILPSYKRLIAVGKKYNKKIMLHSCGSIYRIIPDLIDAGVDILHPIQAQAAGMDAKSLVQFKNDLAFVGGIDAQTFFVNATPQQIKEEVRRVRDILGPNIVISPSHEEILPNVPPENILAMAQAARE
jgi:uroporphyrinogen decarboxylase